jgi:hypothetical protein
MSQTFDDFILLKDFWYDWLSLNVVLEAIVIELVAWLFSLSVRAKTSNSIVFVLIMQLKVSESFKRVWFDTKYVNHWSFDKIAQKRHEVSSFVIRNREFDEIASH